MSNRSIAAIAAAICAGTLSAQYLNDLILSDIPPDPPKGKLGDLTFSGGTLSASRKTGEMSATGDIKAQQRKILSINKSLLARILQRNT